jgi:hypothetical protein
MDKFCNAEENNLNAFGGNPVPSFQPGTVQYSTWGFRL